MSVDDELDRLLAGARADDAARSRAVVGALRDLAAEDATVAGILADLADRGDRVRLAVRGSTIAGAVIEVADGGVALSGVDGESIVRLDAIDAVTCDGSLRFDGDDRRTAARPWLELVQEHLERDDEVVVRSAGTVTRGVVRTIGREVVGLVTPGGSMVYVRTDAIDVVSTTGPRPTSV